MEKKTCTAVVLSAGQGKRMGSKVQKQYIVLNGKPVIYYALKVFQDSPLIDKIVLVAGKGQESYCRTEIIERYGFSKVVRIAEGGSERYHSVWNGLKETEDDGYVFIHDGARPFVTEEMLQRIYHAVSEYPACVAGMPVKDTIKIADEEGYTAETPDRRFVWQVQTPQVFETNIVKEAYRKLMESGNIRVTDDTMVVEMMLGMKVRLVEGSYENIKITTPEDLEIAKIFLERV